MRVAIMGSGRGSNFRAILTAIQRGEVQNVRICVVISNNSDAGILEIARASNIPATHLSQRLFSNEDEFVDALLGVLREHNVNFIALAGYMKKLDSRIIAAFRNRIINIHPALLPKYGGKGMYGMHVHEAVIANGETVTGATVHFVDEEFDHGAIVLQKQVAIDPGDTPEIVAARVLHIEHELYPQALRLCAEGKIPDKGVTVY